MKIAKEITEKELMELGFTKVSYSYFDYKEFVVILRIDYRSIRSCFINESNVLKINVL